MYSYRENKTRNKKVIMSMHSAAKDIRRSDFVRKGMSLGIRSHVEEPVFDRCDGRQPYMRKVLLWARMRIRQRTHLSLYAGRCTGE